MERYAASAIELAVLLRSQIERLQQQADRRIWTRTISAIAWRESQADFGNVEFSRTQAELAIEAALRLAAIASAIFAFYAAILHSSHDKK